ncbi:hypothetical protein VPH35_014202 [Triticum aestivum]|uniref:Uncharacterized protein n=1 Tax=Aegilops tauschii TaxID=37682 RepID=M8C598_AEGTA
MAHQIQRGMVGWGRVWRFREETSRHKRPNERPLGTLRLCVGPRSCYERLVLANGLVVAIAQGTESDQTWPVLAPVVVMGWPGRRFCTVQVAAVRLFWSVAPGSGGGWWFRRAVALVCHLREGLPSVAPGKSLAPAFAGANDGEACGRHTPSWRHRCSRA